MFDLDAWLSGTLSESINNNWNVVLDTFNELANLVTANVLVPFDELLGSNSVHYYSNHVYSEVTTQYEAGLTSGPAVDMLTEIINSVVGSLAFAVLSVVILVQFVKIGQRMDANQMVPAVKEMVMLVVFCVIIIGFVSYSTHIMQGIYDLCNSVTAAIDSKIELTETTSSGLEIGSLLTDAATEESGQNLGLLLMFTIITLIFMLTIIVIAAICCVVSLARGIQILVLYTFAPIMFAFMGLDETRQWSVGYLKNFAAACISGTIMVLVVRLFPIIVNGYASTLGEGVAFVKILIFAIQVIAAAILVATACMKSGSWANAIFGG